MAKVRFRGKEVDNVKKVNIRLNQDTGNRLIIDMVTNANEARRLVYDIKSKENTHMYAKIEGNVNTIEYGNCITVIGNVENAIAGNSMRVEGVINRCDMGFAQMVVDKSIKVDYGNDYRIRIHFPPVRYSIIHITGDLEYITGNVKNMEFSPVIIGNVRNARAGNCLSVKGVVKNAVAKCSVSCTDGVSQGKSIQRIKADAKKREKEIQKMMDNLAGSMSMQIR